MTTDTDYREKGRAVFLAAIVALSMVVGAAAFGASAAAQQEESINTVGGQTYYGETVNVTGVEPDNDDRVEIRSGDPDGDNSNVRYVPVDGTTLELDTSTLEDGDYYISDSNQTSDVFEITNQVVSFEFADDSVSTGSSVDLEFAEDNRALRTDVLIESENLSASDLADAVAGGDYNGNVAEVEGEDQVRVEEIRVGDSIQLEFAEAGDYTVDVTVEDTGAEDSASVTVEDTGPGELSIDDVPAEQAGDWAEIQLSASEVESGWVTISSTHDLINGSAQVELSGIEDGAVLEVNTATLSDGETDASDVFRAENADVESATYTNPALETDENDFADHGVAYSSDFTFQLRSYSGSPEDNRDDDRARLTLEDSSIGDLTTHVAPGSVDLADVDGVEGLLNETTEADSVAEGDLLVAHVEASGIYGYVDETGDLVDETNGLNFTVEQEFQTLGGTNAEATAVDQISSAEAFFDEENDQFAVAFQPTDAMDVGEEADVVFNRSADNDYNTLEDGEHETASATFGLEELELSFSGEQDENDRLVLPTSESSELTAETNAAPGTGGEFFVAGSGFSTTSEEAEVGSDGTLSAQVDLSEATNGDITDDLEAILFHANEDEIETDEGVFGEGESPSYVASGTPPENPDVDEDAQLDVSVENQGGAGEGTVTVTVDGEEVATENLDLTSDDDPWNETFDIPTDEQGEVEWEVSAEPGSSDSGTVQVGDDTSMDGDGDGDGMDGDDGNDTDTDDGDGDGDEQPGFGLVVALFALIGAALLALRRQN